MVNYLRIPLLFVVSFTLMACSEPPDQAAVVGSCPVTQPNGNTPPSEDFEPRRHGNGELWTALWPEGTVLIGSDGPGNIHEDGSLEINFPWWRGPDLQGALEVSGTKLDGQGETLQVKVIADPNEDGFQASTLVFPSEGCWQITATVGDASLTIVTYVAVMD
jgi:hypothetical protein